MQGPWVRFLGWELRSHMLCSMTKHLKNYYFLICFPSVSLHNYKQFKSTIVSYQHCSDFPDTLTVSPCQCRETFLTLFKQMYNILGWGWTRVYFMTLIDNFYIAMSDMTMLSQILLQRTILCIHGITSLWQHLWSCSPTLSQLNREFWEWVPGILIFICV